MHANHMKKKEKLKESDQKFLIRSKIWLNTEKLIEITVTSTEIRSWTGDSRYI